MPSQPPSYAGDFASFVRTAATGAFAAAGFILAAGPAAAAIGNPLPTNPGEAEFASCNSGASCTACEGSCDTDHLDCDTCSCMGSLGGKACRS